MIDNEDADGWLILSFLFKNPILGLLCSLLAIGLSFKACQNERFCAQKSCPINMTAMLADHKCLCTVEAK